MSSELTRMVGIVAVALIAAITALTIFHPGDNLQVIGLMINGALALLAFLSSRMNATTIKESKAETADKLQAMHVDINDRVDQLVKAEKGVSRAEGATEERERVK